MHPKTDKWDYLRSPITKKKSFLVLTSGNFLEALGSRIGTGSIFCLSFSLSNRVTYIKVCTQYLYLVSKRGWQKQVNLLRKIVHMLFYAICVLIHFTTRHLTVSIFNFQVFKFSSFPFDFLFFLEQELLNQQGQKNMTIVKNKD